MELLRVLVANQIGPILMIAFTNHALDHMLCSVLDAGITTDIVRLGSRSADERISQYSIETREMVAGQSRLDHTYNSKYREQKAVGLEISQLIDRIHKLDLDSDSSEIAKYLSLTFPEHHASMSVPPPWINVAKELSQDDAESGEQWKVQGRKGQVMVQDTSMYAFWKQSGDLAFLDMVASPPVPTVPQKNNLKSATELDPSSRANLYEVLSTENTADAETMDTSEEDEHDQDEGDVDVPPEKSWMTARFSDPPDASVESEVGKAPALQPEAPTPAAPVVETEDPYPAYVNDPVGFFAALGEYGVPMVPSHKRTLDVLLHVGDVWKMSRQERQTLHAFWIEGARTQMQKNQQDEFERLRKKHADKVQEYNEIKEQVGRARLGGLYFI